MVWYIWMHAVEMKLEEYEAIVSVIEKEMHQKGCMETLTKEFPKYVILIGCFIVLYDKGARLGKCFMELFLFSFIHMHGEGELICLVNHYVQPFFNRPSLL